MNLKDVKTDVWIRLAVLMLALGNQFLTASGLNPIVVSENELYIFLSNGAMIAVSLWNAWKNNSLTASAQQSDIIMKNLKEAAVKIILDQSNRMLAEQEEAVNAATEKAVQ
jgi:SPP1 family holin